MLEICNCTKTTLPKELESKLDFALGVAIKSVFGNESTLDFGQDFALKKDFGFDFARDKKCDFHIEILFVGAAKMRRFNRDFLGKDYATDVLSFPLRFSLPKNPSEKSVPIVPIPLGSIVINLPLARKNSEKFTHSLECEIVILFIHAVLHLLGFDHENDKGEHRQKECEIMEKLGLKLGLPQNLKSLIFRANSPSANKCKFVKSNP